MGFFRGRGVFWRLAIFLRENRYCIQLALKSDKRVLQKGATPETTVFNWLLQITSSETARNSQSEIAVSELFLDVNCSIWG